jgi:hypothetical protein
LIDKHDKTIKTPPFSREKIAEIEGVSYIAEHAASAAKDVPQTLD